METRMSGLSALVAPLWAKATWTNSDNARASSPATTPLSRATRIPMFPLF